MLAALIPALAPIVERLVGLIPDPNERERQRAALEQQIASAIQQQAAQQAEINKIEAGHSSLFVAGWRPFIGWVCGIGLAWTFVLQPIAVWVIAASGIDATMPLIPTDGLIELVLAMLGLGGLRTFERVKGVERNVLAAADRKPAAQPARPAPAAWLAKQEFGG